MKYDLAGAHVLNKFVWHELSKPVSEGGLEMSTSAYNGLIPIIPTQQVPAFTEMGTAKPFIVYTYTNAGYSENIWSHVEQMSYIVYSDSEQQLRQIGNFLVDLLRRYDLTAEEVNDFIPTIVNGSGDHDEQNFEFHYVTVMATLGPEPYRTEGGRQATSITVRYAYTYDEDERSRRGEFAFRTT
jgi:hypothetical protein